MATKTYSALVVDKIGILKPKDLIATFWGPIEPGCQLRDGQLLDDVDIYPYVEYYRRQWDTIAADADGRYVTVRSHSDIINIIKHLREGESRESILGILAGTQPQNTATENIDNSINLAARLISMLKIGVVKHQATPRRCLVWKDGTLADFIKSRFVQPPVLSHQHVKLPRSFNAWSVNVIGGLRIEFTDNLDDHLLLIDDDTRILIFHYASFLECQHRSLLPQGLAEETLLTLALLFPQSDFKERSRWGHRNKKREWFKRIAADSYPYTIDPRVILCGNLRAEERQLEHFMYWRDRLIILKQAYDDATPRTLGQWWHDRRNGERWYTFWVAVLVLIITTTLGFVQCVESGLQVYKAYYPD